jgi:hypothetical protein
MNDEFGDAFREQLHALQSRTQSLLDWLFEDYYSMVGSEGIVNLNASAHAAIVVPDEDCEYSLSMLAEFVEGFISNRRSLDERRLMIELIRDVLKARSEFQGVECRIPLSSLAEIVHRRGSLRQLRTFCNELGFKWAPGKHTGRPPKTPR